jgi:transketolase
MAEQLYQRDVYGKTLIELGKNDRNIVVLDADLSRSTRTSMFAKNSPTGSSISALPSRT